MENDAKSTGIECCGIARLSDCDVLALAAAISSETARLIKNNEDLLFVANLLTTVGSNLLLMADQRIRREANCSNKKQQTDIQK